MSKLDELIQEYCPNGVEYVKIGDIVNYEQPSKYIVNSTDYNDNYRIPVLTAGQSFILGYTNEKEGHYNASIDNPVIIFDDFTDAFKWVDFEFKVKSSAMKLLTADVSKTSIRYVYHLMGKLNYSSTEHKRLWIATYSNFFVPLPPLPVQEEIVRILDNFTELTAELQARRKQYEYYREKLIQSNGNISVLLSDVAQYAKERISTNRLTKYNYVGVDNLLQNKTGKKHSEHLPTEGNVIEFNKEDVLIGNIRPYLKKIWFADCEGGTNGDVLTIRIKGPRTLIEQGPKACDAPTILESELQMATVKAINKVLKCSDSMQDILKGNIEKVLSEDQTDGKLEALNKVLEAKQHELAQLAKKNVDYSALAGEVDDLREKKQELLVEKAQTEGYKSRIQELGELLKKDCTELTEYDEGMVRNYIKGIKVFDDKFTISFKAGIDIDIQR